MGQGGVPRSVVVDRMACVELPALALQLLLKQHPDWADFPVVVVDRDQPHGRILWANAHAHACRIQTGMRYSAGLSLTRTLYACEVSSVTLEKKIESLVERLHRFSPEVEPCQEKPGVFWLNASGLSHLYASLQHWANEISRTLKAEGFRGSIVVGFTRFGTYALARSMSSAAAVAVVRDRTDECKLVDQVSLSQLGIETTLCDGLQKLGVRTMRAFVQLPVEGIRHRFGKEAYRLHQWATGDLWEPLQPRRISVPFVQALSLDDPEADVSRLLFVIKRLLDQLLVKITAHHQRLTELTLRLQLDHSAQQIERIRLATPTVDGIQVMKLIRLRLESLLLKSGVTGLRLTGRVTQVENLQQELFVERPRRDFRAANRALACVRAEFGDAVVVYASLTDAHLPEAQFAWNPFGVLLQPEPMVATKRSMVRRIHAHPVPLLPCPQHGPNGWFVHRDITSPVCKLAGPYFVSGGWWRSLVHREYYFAYTRSNDALWIYYDRPRRQWYWQGQVE